MSSQTVRTFQDMGGTSRNLLRFAEKDDKLWSAFNPSICRNPDGQLAMVFRSSNYLLGDMQLYTSLTTGYDIHNKVYFCELEVSSDSKAELIIKSPPQLLIFNPIEISTDNIKNYKHYKRGVEDCRLLWRDGAWHLLGVVLEAHVPVARQGLFQVDLASKTAETCGIYASVEESRVEKNWGALAVGTTDQFDFIYSPDVVAHVVDGLGETNINKPPTTSHIELSQVESKLIKLNKNLLALRGGTQLIEWDGGKSYLAVNHITRKTPQIRFNSRTFCVETVELRDYTHVFVKYALDGRILAVSDEFTFGGALVEFAAGLAELDGTVYISYGRNDLSSHVASLPVEQVNASLRYL